MSNRRQMSPHRVAQLATYAAGMRWAPSPSEEHLWKRLAGGQLGVVFRRQVVIASVGCIADFVAREARLVVEVDGGWHVGRERADARRDRRLEQAGYRVLRLDATLVLERLDVAVERVRDALAAGRR